MTIKSEQFYKHQVQCYNLVTPHNRYVRSSKKSERGEWKEKERREIAGKNQRRAN